MMMHKWVFCHVVFTDANLGRKSSSHSNVICSLHKISRSLYLHFSNVEFLSSKFFMVLIFGGGGHKFF